MIKLEKITKEYKNTGKSVLALKGISLTFRDAEFVSILGPSGCGKTTLLNIIGGLDHYNSGDMQIDGISTKNYNDQSWDTYRNHRVGFVFQSYNLIPHQTVLENVELALNIAGFGREERIEKAKKALDRVGLTDHYHKKPSQLSGGQCQRVAIARALVNDPEILLADEPTGALDTKTSVQIMDIIKEISKETLVVMVTHNPELADKYSTRIIKLLDGDIIADSNPYTPEQESLQPSKKEQNTKKSKLKILSTIKLSARNLWSKFKRTIMVCIAGSIGIIGVASVLSVSVGIQTYINNMQNDMLSGNPVVIEENTFNISGLIESTSYANKKLAVENSIEDGYINVDKMIEFVSEMAGQMENITIQNQIDQNYINYLLAMPEEYYSAYNLGYGINLTNNIYTQSPFTNQQDKIISLEATKQIYTSILEQTDFAQYASLITTLNDVFVELPSSAEFVLGQYEMLDSSMTYPQNANQIAIVVNDQNEISDLLLAQLGYLTQEEFINAIYKATEDSRHNPALDKTKFSYQDLMNKTFTWYPNNTVYTAVNGNPASPFTYNPYATSAFANGIEFEITCILEPKEGLSYGCLDTGFYYTNSLTQQTLADSLQSEIVTYLKNTNQTSIPSGNNGGGDFGIKYQYSFVFEGTEFNDVTGFIGSQDAFASLMGGQNQSIPKILSLRDLGGEDLPNKISFYPVDFEIKDQLIAYLDVWNSDQDIIVGGQTLTKDQRTEITYSDNLALVMDMISGMISMITTALVAFTALSLVVSTVMIAIITYVSVIERIKEIGVIRSLGGRKKDVSRLFIAESGIIGGISGAIGIVITWLLTLLINSVAGMTIATLTLPIIVIMITISIALTLISGVMPARSASKKDPAVALRSE